MTIITEEKLRCIHVKGRLDVNTSNELDQALGTLPDNGQDIIIDMSECPYLSSAGIRILLKSRKKLQSGQNELFLTGVIPEIMQVLEIAGLKKILRFEPDVESALAHISSVDRNKDVVTEISVEHHHMIYTPAGENRITGHYCNEKEILSYQELGYAVGFGSLSDKDEVGTDDLGLFVTLEHCCGFIPGNSSIDPDFRITSDPAKAGIMVDEALSFGNRPSGSLRMTTHGMLTYSQMTDALARLMERDFPEGSVSMMVLTNSERSRPTLSLALSSNQGLDRVLMEKELKLFRTALAGEKGKPFTGITFRLGELNITPQENSLGEIIRKHLTFENILGVERLNPGAFLEEPIVWLFHTNAFSDGRSHRLSIETSPGLVFEPRKAFLARLLYTDSSRLHIDPLHGGYSAETFRVTSYDEEGRRMRPTVLKIARRELISRESERCQQFALPYIFNNCAVVLGAEHFGEMMALRYNFVGIGGESKQLKWMTHFYQESDIPLLESLFDKVFLQILHTWYGQPVKKTIFPFKDHDPTLTFFPHIFQTVSDLFSISSDEKLIRIPESDQPILNPYWFLKHEYPARREQGMEYLTGICHGDLNMQNILLDENMNIYLIDFSETKPRSVISDFARLEAIFMIDNAPVGTETDMKDYLQFIRQFYACDRLGKVPEAAYKGREGEKVKKNVALTMKMRQYAFDSAKGDPNAIPYFIALLEWVLPVVCYTSLPEHQKRLSMIVSSILAEKVSATL